MATVTPMANEAMKQNWAGGGERWAANERIIDSSFTMVTEAIVTAADLGGATRVLDIGCGTGTLLEAVIAAGAEAVGVDISPPMVDAALRRVPDATVVVADAQTDDLLALAPGAPFDRVVSRFGVMFFDDPVAAFENIRAATAPGGELAFACWRADSSDIFTAGLGPLAARMATPLDEPKVGEPGPLGLATSEMIGDTLALAGWTNVIEVALDVTLDYSIDGSDGVEERLAMALSGVLGRTARAELEPRLGPDGWVALLDEARAELRTFIVDGSVRFPGHIWLVTATNPNDVDDL
jgi:SAM-dependent methyltransferase